VTGVETFAPLVIWSLKDNYEGLNRLREEGERIFQFTGESKEYKHIWDVFQYIIAHPFHRHQHVFLNGDWPFVNAVLGLMGPQSSNPCPICTVPKNDLLSVAQSRPLRSIFMQYSAVYSPLLLITHYMILPTPLHIFLGICNRILSQILPNYTDRIKLDEAKKKCKSVYSYGGGAATLEDLNGPELSRFISTPHPFIQEEKALTCIRWMKEMYNALLHKRRWETHEEVLFSSFVDEIQRDWKKITGKNPFPQLHMLRHCTEFASHHHYLGRFSEAQLESYHYTFNHATKYTHRNQGNNIEEKYRRALADRALQLVQPLLQQ
jgi:hypothetical protein